MAIVDICLRALLDLACGAKTNFYGCSYDPQVPLAWQGIWWWRRDDDVHHRGHRANPRNYWAVVAHATPFPANAK